MSPRRYFAAVVFFERRGVDRNAPVRVVAEFTVNILCAAERLHSTRQEFRQCVEELLWPFEVRNVAGTLDLR
jgi:hypothetical protein